MGDILSPYCWIDQPAELDRFGARAYYQRVKGQIETFDGAAQLFEELLNYLWERVDPEETRTSDDDDKNNSRRPRRRPGQQSDGDGVPEPPPAADFISEELLVDSIHWAIDGQFRYDRSVPSLRELLSLVLLRLTAPTQLDADTVTDGPAEYPKPGSDERTVKVVRAQEALRRYVLDYCKRYGRRLLDAAFVEKIGPWLLFQNHFTLGRVLIELTRRLDAFTQDDFQTCYWHVWSPLLWPEVVGLEGKPALRILQAVFGEKEVSNQWLETGMPSMTVIATNLALGQPHDTDSPIQVRKFLVAQELLLHLQRYLGDAAYRLKADAMMGALGGENIAGIETTSTPRLTRDQMRQHAQAFLAIRNYVSPIEKRLAPLLALARDEMQGQDHQRIDLECRAIESGLEPELRAWQHQLRPIWPIPEGHEYCPKCHGRLTRIAIHHLNQSKLVLCSVSKDAWLYQRLALPERII